MNKKNKKARIYFKTNFSIPKKRPLKKIVCNVTGWIDKDARNNIVTH